MRNIEIKAPLPDRAAVLGRLERLGAKKRWRERQRDTFYDVPHGWLKLREQGERAELISYVRDRKSAEPRQSDYDVEPLADPARWHRLLGRVLPVDGTVVKTRELWTWKTTRIHLDDVDGLGEFLELETVVGERSTDVARRETDEVAAALGLDASTFLSVPYRELLDREGETTA